MAAGDYLTRLMRDLEAPMAVRRFGSGWFAGFFALLFAVAGLGMVIALRWPGWFAMPELDIVKSAPWFRGAVHATLLSSYVLALLSLLLRPRKVLGATALGIGLGATLLGGAQVDAHDAGGWGIFFGVDFFIVNLIVTGLMFAPIERLFPHRPEQRLFRVDWREDLFYFLVSSMFVQVFSFLALAPSAIINANTDSWSGFRADIASLPWLVQFVLVIFLADLFQYGYHRLFHAVPFLWRFHAVHHSPKALDWLAGSRLHFVEVVLLRAVTSLPLFTLGFGASVMQAYVAFVYVYSSLLHANLRGDFNRLGKWIATPRYHHWHHGLEQEAHDVNFAIHFPWIDRVFGTFHLPDGRWPENYGVLETVPKGYPGQFAYPFTKAP